MTTRLSSAISALSRSEPPLTDLPSALVLAYAVVGIVAVWIAAANLRALARYRAGLGGRPASRAARMAWLLSVLSPATGPLVVVTAVVALAFGLRERRRAAAGEISRRSRLPAEMAIKTSAVVVCGAAVTVLCVYLALAGRPLPEGP